MSISKKIRFEVFKRDLFTCQYCGGTAPKILLELDHISPKAKAGGDEIINLVTACTDCNRGKSDRVLSDDTAITRKHKQLAELQKRKEQLDMMFEWQKSLDDLEGDAVNKIADYWSELMPGNHLTEYGLRDVAKLIKQYGLSLVIESMRTATSGYEDPIIAFKKIGGICRLRNASLEEKAIYYIRGILRNRVYINDAYCLPLLRRAVRIGATLDSLRELALNVRNWSEWRSKMEKFIADNDGADSAQ